MENNKQTLNYQEQVALEGQISLFLSTSPHDEEMLYRIFMLLESAPSWSLNYLINEIKEQILTSNQASTITEEILDLIALQAREHETPVWLWVNRCAADIKQYAEGTEIAFSPYKLSINKKVARKKIVRSAFCVFIRKLGLISSPAAKVLLDHLSENEDFKFLHDLCFVLRDAIAELDEARPPKKIIGKDVLDISFEPKEILNFNKMLEFRGEIVDPEKSEDMLLEYADVTEEEEVVSEKVSMLKNTLEGIVKQLSDKPETTEDNYIEPEEKYVVTKKQGEFKTMLKIFNTKAEAENFIREIKAKAPDLKAEFGIQKLGKLK